MANRVLELPKLLPSSPAARENAGLAVLAASCLALLWTTGR